MHEQRTGPAALRARQQAFEELIRRHQEEWDMILAHFRTSAGLSAKPGGPNRETLQRKIDRYERLLQQARNELGEEA